MPVKFSHLHVELLNGYRERKLKRETEGKNCGEAVAPQKRNQLNTRNHEPSKVFLTG